MTHVTVASKLPGALMIGRIRVAGTKGLPGADDPPLVAGYRLTWGVPLSEWDAWLAQNGQSDMFLGGYIGAHVEPNQIRQWCYDHASVPVGMSGGVRPA